MNRRPTDSSECPNYHSYVLGGVGGANDRMLQNPPGSRPPGKKAPTHRTPTTPPNLEAVAEPIGFAPLNYRAYD